TAAAGSTSATAATGPTGATGATQSSRAARACVPTPVSSTRSTTTGNAAGTPRSPRSALAPGSVPHALAGATSAADARGLRCNEDDGDERFRHHHPPPKNGDATRYCTSRALDRIRATASLSVGREGTSEVVALYFRSD